MPEGEEMDTLTIRVARLLTEAKERNGFTFTELGERTGFGRASVVRWLNGSRSPQLRDLEVLCSALGLDLRMTLDRASAPGNQG